MLKVKNIRTADCVVGGFRYGTGSKLSRPRCCSASTTPTGGSTMSASPRHLPTRTRPASPRGSRPCAAPGFTGNAPGGPSRWSTERSGEWHPLRPELVVEVSYDHVTGDRFRHGTGFMRWRPDKAPRQCTYEQLHLDARPSTVIQQTLGT